MIVRILTILMFLLVSSSAFAQVPAVVPVQGILTDEQGTAIDGDTPVTFTFYDDSDNSLWSETFSVAVDNGFFSVGLGAGTNALDLSIFRDNDAVELGIKVGSDDEMTPRMSVGSVPYAARSAWADEALDAVALSGQSLSDLDSRFLTDEADSVDSTNITDGTLTSADVASPLSLYEVTSIYCEQEAGTLMTKDWCYARQDTADTCSNTCSGVTPIRVRRCDGSCGCANLVLCQIGQPCNPRENWPRCQNQPLAGFALPN